jgi:hypothetical protein
MKFKVTFLFLLICTIAYSQNNTMDTSFVGSGFSIQYPSSWSIDTSGKMGTQLFIFSPLVVENDQFRENINIIIQDLQGLNIDLNTYKYITDDQLLNLVTSPTVYESKVYTSTPTPYYKAAYSMTQGKLRLRITSICYIKEDKAFLATFTCEEGQYQLYQSIGDQILHSFKVSM